jgi:hypothetical protein
VERKPTKPKTALSAISHASTFRFLYIVPALLCIGCSSIPHRAIFIADTSGRPIPGADLGPYPILLRNFLPGSTGNSTDSHGRIELYDVNHGGDYTLSARGFSIRHITFPQNDNVCYTLKSAN